jgi:choline kinase
MAKVIILNSGTGSRMGKMTSDKPKCLVKITAEDTILSRQLKALAKVGLQDVILTTGPYEDKIQEHVEASFKDFNFTFINNPQYRDTNYIYSIFLLDGLINDDVYLMHGDLVFDQIVLNKLIDSEHKDAVLVNPNVKLPEKDFKGKIVQGEVKKIGVDVFGDDCVFLIPIYKLSLSMFRAWMAEISKFYDRDELKVYAENALNNLLDQLPLHSVELNDEFCMEIDDPVDLEVARQHLAKNEEVE